MIRRGRRSTRRAAGHARGRAARLLALALLWLAGLPAPALAQGTPGEPDGRPARPGAARGPQAELGSEFWTLAARFETGELLVVELCITNVGLGDGNAAVIGHWIEADGTVLAFDGAKASGRWTLSEERTRLEIGKLALDLGGEQRRLLVWKERLQLELELGEAPAGIAIGPMTGADHGFEVLALATPVAGHVQLEGGERRALRGQATLTHRWVERIESRITLRRIELVATQGDVRAYLIQAVAPSGESTSWLLVLENGRITHSEPVTVEARMSAVEASGPFPLPEALILEGPSVRGRIELADPLVRYDPLRDLPALVRLVVAPFLRWRSSWSTSLFELDFRDRPGGPLSLRGQGLVNVTYFDAAPVAATTGAECRDDCAGSADCCP